MTAEFDVDAAAKAARQAAQAAVRARRERDAARPPDLEKDEAPAGGAGGAPSAMREADADHHAPAGARHGHGLTLPWTTFKDDKTTQGRRETVAWPTLAQRLANPSEHNGKKDCPLFRGGVNVTDSRATGSRIDTIFLLVAEHDAEQVEPQQAAELLRSAGISAVIFTSARHRVARGSAKGGPRWRVVLPLAEPIGPDKYGPMLDKLNGALGGSLAPESWEVSRCWYFGRVKDVPFEAYISDGAPFDDLDALFDFDPRPVPARVPPQHEATGGTLDSFERLTLAHEVTARTIHDLRYALAVIPSDDRALWIAKTGHAIAFLMQTQFADEARALWVDYTQKSAAYQPGDENQIDTIKAVDSITHKSIFHLADQIDPTWRARADAAWVDADVVVDLSTAEPVPLTSPTAQDAAEGFPAPFPGVMADTVAAALQVAPKPQPELTTLAVLAGMAAGCPGRYRLPGDGRLNLYAVGIADTGAGKDLPRRVGVELASLAGAAVIGEPASGQGLEDALVADEGMLTAIDEIAHMLAAMNDTHAPVHLKSLSANLLKLYSAGSGLYASRVRAATKGAGVPMRAVQNPCLNVLGFTTPESLGAAVTTANVGDGLLGRVLMAEGRAGVAPRLLRANLHLPDRVVAAAAAVRDAHNAHAFGAGKTCIDITVAGDVQGHMEDLLVALDAEASAAQESAFARAVLQRSFEKLMRIAGVLAVWEAPAKPVITRAHVDWAERAVRASNRAMVSFIEHHMHGGQVQANAARVLAVMKKAMRGELQADRAADLDALAKGWIPGSLVLKRSKLSARDMAEAVQHLKASGEIEVGVDKRDGAQGGTRIVQLLRVQEVQ